MLTVTSPPGRVVIFLVEQTWKDEYVLISDEEGQSYYSLQRKLIDEDFVVIDKKDSDGCVAFMLAPSSGMLLEIRVRRSSSRILWKGEPVHVHISEPVERSFDGS